MTKAKKKTAGGKAEPATAYQIWLAGLGALAAAEQQGSKLFKNLVDMGHKYDTGLRDGIEKASGSIRARADEAKGIAGKAWTRLEATFEDQVGATLKRLNVPTRGEIAKLGRRVEELTSKVDGVRAGPARKKAAARKKKAGKKKVVKKKTAKNKAAKKKPAPRKKAGKKTSARSRARG